MSTSGISTSALHASGGGLQKYDMNNKTTVADDEKYQSKKINDFFLMISSYSIADTWWSEIATSFKTDEHDIEVES